MRCTQQKNERSLRFPVGCCWTCLSWIERSRKHTKNKTQKERKKERKNRKEREEGKRKTKTSADFWFFQSHFGRLKLIELKWNFSVWIEIFLNEFSDLNELFPTKFNFGPLWPLAIPGSLCHSWVPLPFLAATCHSCDLLPVLWDPLPFKVEVNSKLTWMELFFGVFE